MVQPRTSWAADGGLLCVADNLQNRGSDSVHQERMKYSAVTQMVNVPVLHVMKGSLGAVVPILRQIGAMSGSCEGAITCQIVVLRTGFC